MVAAVESGVASQQTVRANRRRNSPGNVFRANDDGWISVSFRKLGGFLLWFGKAAAPGRLIGLVLMGLVAFVFLVAWARIDWTLASTLGKGLEKQHSKPITPSVHFGKKKGPIRVEPFPKTAPVVTESIPHQVIPRVETLERDVTELKLLGPQVSLMAAKQGSIDGTLEKVNELVKHVNGLEGRCSSLETSILVRRPDGSFSVNEHFYEQLLSLLKGDLAVSGPSTSKEPFDSTNITRKVKLLLADAKQQFAKELTELKSGQETELKREMESRLAMIEDKLSATLRQQRTKEHLPLNYALLSLGARVLPYLTSGTFRRTSDNIFMEAMRMGARGKPPQIVLIAENSAGNCWAFTGPSGTLTISLAQSIIPSEFAIAHLEKLHGLDRGSAPKDILVYGMKRPEEEGELLATFRYDLDGDAVQRFPASRISEEKLSFVQLRILSNWGNKEFTCLYQFMVFANERIGSGEMPFADSQ